MVIHMYSLILGVPYTIKVMTSDKSNAGTSARVYIMMYGGKDGEETSGKIWLDNGKFSRGRTDIFNVEVAKALSPLSRLEVGHDNTGPGSGWHLEKVCKKSNQILSWKLRGHFKSLTQMFIVDVLTAISMILSFWIALCLPVHPILMCTIFLCILYLFSCYIKISLSLQISVNCPSAGVEQWFMCDKWFALDEGDCLIERVLYENKRMRISRKKRKYHVFCQNLNYLLMISLESNQSTL